MSESRKYFVVVLTNGKRIYCDGYLTTAQGAIEPNGTTVSIGPAGYLFAGPRDVYDRDEQEDA